MRRESILASARELIQKFGLSSLVMDDVAQHCGMSKKTIYQIFSGKDELINELTYAFLEEEKLRLSEDIKHQASGVDKIHYITNFLSHVIEVVPYENLFVLQRRHRESFGLFESFCKDVKNILEETIVNSRERGEVDPRIKPEILTEHVLSQIYFLQKNYKRLMAEDSYDYWKKQFSLYLSKILLS